MNNKEFNKRLITTLDEQKAQDAYIADKPKRDLLRAVITNALKHDMYVFDPWYSGFAGQVGRELDKAGIGGITAMKYNGVTYQLVFRSGRDGMGGMDQGSPNSWRLTVINDNVLDLDRMD